MALWDWCQNKITTFKKTINDTVDKAISACKYAWSFSPYLTNFFDFEQFWFFFSRVADPNIVPKLKKSPNTRKVLAYGFAANMVFLAGCSFVYEAFYNHNAEETEADRLTKLFTAWYFYRLSYRLFLSINPLLNASMSKAASVENPNKAIFPACPCGENSVDVVKANLASGFYYISHLLAARFMGTIIPYSEYYFLAHAYGEALLEYNLGNMCTKHRYEKIAENNNGALGFGASMILTTKFWSFVLSALAQKLQNYLWENPDQIDGKYIEEGVSSFVFLYFIMLAILIDQPYPGTERGLDIFYHARLVMESMLKIVGDKIIKFLKQPGTQFVLQPIIDAVTNSPPYIIFKYAFLWPDYITPHSYVKTAPVQLFLDLRGDDIQAVLDWFIKVRKAPKTRRLAMVMPYIPNFLMSKEIKAIIKFLIQEKLNGTLEDINNFITTARLKVKIYDLQALQQIISELNPPIPAPEPTNLLPAPSTSNETALVVRDPNIPAAEKNVIEEKKEKELNTWLMVEPSQNNLTLVGLFNKYKKPKRNKPQTRTIDLSDDIMENWEDLASHQPLQLKAT